MYKCVQLKICARYKCFNIKVTGTTVLFSKVHKRLKIYNF